MPSVLLSDRARGRLDDLENDTAERIKDALRDLDPQRDLKALSDVDGHRLRVGDYRVIVDWDRDESTVYVLTLGHRRNIYDQDC
ncbi:type II toxin-antitoxin system RelE/ParE family toxin [Halodesulfurarchaeum sp. HSR-GB]|uniref:type II toxin-antitoxin system RelE family toxin n=1 Tax=Halodesulfurarchaeum sp. HSR-GB TaxID=3074077 RepID=UPI00285BBB7D|nr:type II toxin-antitoxin system RelE/ParE family toxin [Halodesulfurarchaeum sp. HSR-GB]MDR5656982.1 type II toxin-antitoxin system RelE/ParE family toxin [Halodesulfurarchaeum sp. HSR-GB]